jgi:hypothetical protein
MGGNNTAESGLCEKVAEQFAPDVLVRGSVNVSFGIFNSPGLSSLGFESQVGLECSSDLQFDRRAIRQIFDLPG